MIEDKDFLSKGSFECEIDASMYPNPKLVLTVTSLLLKENP